LGCFEKHAILAMVEHHHCQCTVAAIATSSKLLAAALLPLLHL